jgi:CAAX prenyl protease-like protein
MTALRKRLESRPALARVLPFAVFLGLTLLQGRFGAASLYHVYLLKTLLGAYLLWLVWPLIPEMRWRFGWDAVLTGVVVFALWVSISDGWATQHGLWNVLADPAAAAPPSPAWNPFATFAHAPGTAWFFVAVRVIGSGLVVPPIEEAFYRSFVYRSLVAGAFDKVALGHFAWRPFLFTSLVFGFAHQEWLAGILCGAAYQALVIRHGRLGEAMTAHAITNVLLGTWVVATGDWQFW